MATVLPRLGEVGGALGGIRTHGLSLRRAALYPAELQAPSDTYYKYPESNK